MRIGKGNRKATLKEFIEKAQLVHGDRYDYSSVEYNNAITKIKINCEKHGVFEQTPNNHLADHGCPKCAKPVRTVDEFIRRARLTHGDKYDYSLVDYVKSYENVIIVCPKHGKYLQKPKDHLYEGGCPKCGKGTKTTEEFIVESKKIHGNEYDYSLVKYVDEHTKVNIVCKKHGIFSQRPYGHTDEKGCPKCSGKNKTTEDYINQVKLIHGDKYDYSLAEYIDNKTKIKIICEKHGVYEQMPYDHIDGCGCPRCNESKGELVITNYLKTNGFVFIREKGFDDCRNINKLPFDFYLPNHNALIEYDGLHHYKPLDYFGGVEGFKKQQLRDNIKNEYAKNNNINLLRIRFDEYKNINEILDKNIKTWQTQQQM